MMDQRIKDALDALRIAERETFSATHGDTYRQAIAGLEKVPAELYVSEGKSMVQLRRILGECEIKDTAGIAVSIHIPWDWYQEAKLVAYSTPTVPGEDTKRLDWLEKANAVINRAGGNPAHWWVAADWIEAPRLGVEVSLRQAIDHAMSRDLPPDISPNEEKK